jgi:hypothetical protein
MDRSKKLESLLNGVSAFCPIGCKYEIEKVLGIVN